MSWATKLLGDTAGGLITGLGDVVDKFVTTPDEKQKIMLELEKQVTTKFSELEQTHRAELQAKERVLVAELTQEDKYTKRARPSVVYTGLFVVVCNYVFIPVLTQAFGIVYQPIELPAGFWGAWGGLVATWTIGRSFEKVGIQSKTTSVITGSKSILE